MGRPRGGLLAAVVVGGIPAASHVTLHARARDQYVFYSGDTTCEDAGYASIFDASECLEAATEERRPPQGWGGKVHVGMVAGYTCGCLYLEALGNVELWLPPGCSKQKTCSDLDGCFCRRVEAPSHDEGADPGDHGVSCGRHFAASCAECPKGHGKAWCNGNCEWGANDECVAAKVPESPGAANATALQERYRRHAAALAVEDAIASLLGSATGSWPTEAPPLAPGADAEAPAADAEARHFQCPGAFDVEGYGPVELVNAKWNVPGERAKHVALRNDTIVPQIGGRSYFADACRPGKYDNKDYVAWKLLGKTLKYTTDISESGCGCNVALYMTSLHQSESNSSCGDHYCDANRVCGEACAEIDVQEANNRAWHSTLHVSADGGGIGGGYGGGANGWSAPRDWSKTDYGPGSRCIDTRKPFQVAVSFPTDADGTLAAMSLVLSQEGHGCTVSTCLKDYKFIGGNSMRDLTDALSAGMTPIVSYWTSDILIGMDGRGPDGQGPCEEDSADNCGDTVKFYDFKLEDIAPGQPTCQPKCSSFVDDCRSTRCCNEASHACFEKNAAWASCRETCEPGIHEDDPKAVRSPWSCRVLGDAREIRSASRVPEGPRVQNESQKEKPPPPSPAPPPALLPHPPAPPAKRPAGLAVPGPACTRIGGNCKDTGCCTKANFHCFEKNDKFASCLLQCKPGVDHTEPEEFRSPWTCRRILRAAQDEEYALVRKFSQYPSWRATGALSATTAVVAGALGAAAVAAAVVGGLLALGRLASERPRRGADADAGATSRSIRLSTRGYLSLQLIGEA